MTRRSEDGLLRKLGSTALFLLGSYTIWSANTFFDDFRYRQDRLSEAIKAVSKEISDLSNTTSRIDERTASQERRISNLESIIGSVTNRVR
jgi:predicted  nucleic acid-binding Zn-ribbon protein